MNNSEKEKLTARIADLENQIVALKEGEIKAEQYRCLLEEKQNILDQAEQGGAFGTWDWDLIRQRMEWSGGLFRLLGIPPRDFSHDLQAMARFIHPDDREDFLVGLQQIFDTGHLPRREEFRVCLPDGSMRFVLIQGLLTHDTDGKAVRVAGIVHDITQVKKAIQDLEESRQKYRYLVDMAQEGIWEVDAKGLTLFTNQRINEMLGCWHEEMLGQPLWAWMDEEEAQKIQLLFTDCKSPQKISLNVQLRPKEKEKIHVHLQIAPTLSQEGLFTGAIITLIDISDITQAEGQLRQQAGYLAALQDTSLGLLSQLELADLLEAIVQRACALLHAPSGLIATLNGTRKKVIIQATVGMAAEFNGKEYDISSIPYLEAILLSREPAEFNNYFETTQFTTLEWVHASYVVPLISKGEIMGVLGLSHDNETASFQKIEQDILTRFAQLAAVALENSRLHEALQCELTERKRVEAVLKERDRFLSSLVENLPGLVFRVSSLQGKWIPEYVSNNIQEFSGYDLDWLISEKINLVDFIYAADLEKMTVEFFNSISQNRHFEIEIRILMADKQYKWVLSRGRGLVQPNGSVQVEGILFDISENKKTQLALEESETKLRSVIAQASDGFILVDAQHIVIEWNKVMQEITQAPREEVVGKPLLEILARLEPRIGNMDKAGSRKRMMNFLSDEDYSAQMKRIVEFSLKSLDGSIRTIQLSFMRAETPGGLIRGAIMRDISEYRKVEQQLIESQKLASLGTLAAGIAHEINTPLQIITGSSGSLLVTLKDKEFTRTELMRRMEMINKNAWRAADIIKSLQEYARPAAQKMEPIRLNDLIKDTLLLVEHQLKSWSSVLIQTHLDISLPEFAGDHNKITQVIINLLTNARDAMPRGGEITLSTKYLPETHQVLLSVADTGVGIPKNLIDKIFDPFFTTKPIGQGSGLGLSIINGIIRAHGGRIEVESIENEGSCFNVFFPQEISPPAQIERENAGRFE